MPAPSSCAASIVSNTEAVGQGKSCGTQELEVKLGVVEGQEMRGGEHRREPLHGHLACIDHNDAVWQGELDEPHVVFERVQARRLGVHGQERSGTERRQYGVELGTGRDVLRERAISSRAYLDTARLSEDTPKVASVASDIVAIPLNHCTMVD